MVVADILGVDPATVNVRVGHDSYWNSHAGFSGTYASQFAVTGPERGQGRHRDARARHPQARRRRARSRRARRIVLEGGFAKRRDNPEAALPFFAVGAIVNANNAVLSEEAARSP